MKSKQQRADQLYVDCLRLIESAIGHNETTDESELERIGKGVFGSRFSGVYARNELPSNLRRSRKFAICNLDDRNQAGSHWVAIAGNLMYDSFGRKLDFGMETPDSDSEQTMDENNCGQRSLAWLCVYQAMGHGGAKLI